MRYHSCIKKKKNLHINIVVTAQNSSPKIYKKLDTKSCFQREDWRMRIRKDSFKKKKNDSFHYKSS